MITHQCYWCVLTMATFLSMLIIRFANNESFDKAVADFKMALSVDPVHHNARTYLVETLLNMGRM